MKQIDKAKMQSLLERMAAFNIMSGEEIGILSDYLVYKIVPDKTILYRMGVQGGDLMFIVKGEAGIWAPGVGVEDVRVGRTHKNYVLGMYIIPGLASPVTIRAESEMQYLALSDWKLEELKAKWPGLVNTLYERILYLYFHSSGRQGLAAMTSVAAPQK